MPAFLAAPLVRWLAVGIALAVLFGLWQMERHDRIAAEKGEKAAQLESSLHAADATRWQAAASDRDRVIVSLKDQIETQNALIEAGETKRAEIMKALDAVRIENDRVAAQADRLAKELADEAKASPGDVREVGPIVKRRVGGLWE